ncbi:hypothetical protein ElyMa_006022200 [Elysia marginata]|uniref:Uncharacterized protein n=1 Tax=Elysia marginata TaxID=1093978 RepID=A0AAV4GIB3_9GAST|nr:hypothetical protein ElyMa_006022200 [Elysia marginata]
MQFTHRSHRDDKLLANTTLVCSRGLHRPANNLLLCSSQTCMLANNDVGEKSERQRHVGERTVNKQLMTITQTSLGTGSLSDPLPCSFVAGEDREDPLMRSGRTTGCNCFSTANVNKIFR